MINNTTAKSTYTTVDGVTEYEIGFEYEFNPNGTPQFSVVLNKHYNYPLEYGTDYELSDNGLDVVLLIEVVSGDRLDIYRNIPIVQLSDYHVGRIDPEQIERDFDLAAERDQQIDANLSLIGEVPEDHEVRIEDLETEVASIDSKIPEQATSSNQLADKNFVNSSIATSTATFRGTYSSLAELEEVEADENDYGFVTSVDAAGNTLYSRYKYTGTLWVFEYTLNNSSFTADQWAAINSGVTTTTVAKANSLPVVIKNVMMDGVTGAISFLPSSQPTTVTVRTLVGGVTIAGTVTESSGVYTFTPTTASDILTGEWTLEVE